MGSRCSKSYNEQKDAIKNKLISFELNLYFIGEDLSTIYDYFTIQKKQDNIYSYWNYDYYPSLSYEKQLEKINEDFQKVQTNFKKDSKNNIFKEVIIAQIKDRNDKVIKKIFDLFGGEKDVFCPFIIFLIPEEEMQGNTSDGQIENIIPDQEEYYLSPLKVNTYRFNKSNIDGNQELFKRLFRICSYYNELGDQFIIWPEKGKTPYPYDLVNCDSPSYINIFCLGKTGSGKSTFLNKFFKEKKSKEGGTGNSTTKKIVRFGLQDIPIRIYDIPGFEGKETIEIVNKKLVETTKEMNNDGDRAHLILYFINYEEETVFYDMEETIINTLKENNSEIRIIFVLTHCINNPYEKISKKKLDAIKLKIENKINIIGSHLGKAYSFESGYFKKDSLIQDNLILVNLLKNYETDKEEFGFEDVIRSIYKTFAQENFFEVFESIEKKLFLGIKNKIINDKKFEKEIEDILKKSYLLSQTTFAIQKDKAIKEAEKLYNNMFSIGRTLLALCPILRDIKLGLIKYQKYMFKKNLQKIFGFYIENESFKDIDLNNNLENINETYYENKKKEKDNSNKKELIKEIRKDYHETEVSSAAIVANEVVGFVSYICLFGGPIGMTIGGVGIVGTSYISFNQFKKDCTEYFEQYKKHYEENKYLSLLNYVVSVQKGIQYFKTYVDNMENERNKVEDNNSSAPNPSEINETIKDNLKSIIKLDNIKVPVLN